MARLAPERRTRLDLAISASLVVLVLLAGFLLWWTSPARTTELTTAAEEPPIPLATETLPTQLRELWRAPSAATDVPAVAKAVVVTAEGSTVTGHDPETGRELYRYSRRAQLCAAIAAWPGGENDVLAVYRNSRGCSEVTALDGDTGERSGQRSSDADSEISLSYDTSFALAAGQTRLETWGTNLVRGIEYGRVDAPVNPDVAPGRPDCRIFSAVTGGDRVALVERCADDAGYRLTVLSATLDSDDKVKQWASVPLTDTSHGAPPVVIATTDQTVTVYDGGQDSGHQPMISTYGTDGSLRASNTVDGDPVPPATSRTLTSQGLRMYWTGRSTVVLDAATGEPTVQVIGSIGPGERGTALLVPMPGAISVRDPSDGRELHEIRVDRGAYTGPVSLRVLGPYVIEQRGAEIVVLGPPES